MATITSWVWKFLETGELLATYGPQLMAAGANTDSLCARGLPFGTLVMKLLAGTVPTSVQLQGSNDNFAVEVVALGPAVTASLAAGVAWCFGPGVIPGATATNFVQPVPSGFRYYRFLLVGGDGTTQLQVDGSFTTPRG